MSVVGFDFGSSTCFIAAPRTRGIETLDNDYSERATPCYISFTSLRRYTGTSASNQKITNISNTVTGFKNLLGLKFSDPIAQAEMSKNVFSKYVKLDDDEIGIKVKYLDKEEVYTPIQLTAMMLNELKINAARHLGTKSMNVILSCPVYFNSVQRRALAAAAYITELNLMGIINDSEATGISYGLYRTFSQQEATQSKIVMFLDIGYSSTQVYLCNFEGGNKISVISSIGSTNFGGRDVDEKICSYFIEEFKKKYNIDTRTNPKAWLKLLTESSNIKKKVNSSSATLPLSIECFMNDIDVTSTINREQVEQMCCDYLKNVENLLDQAISLSSIPILDIDKQISSIEIVGGSTRLTMIKELIKRKFNRDISTTLNCDEAVSRGCALYCAKLSPSIQIKNFEIFDSVYYDVRAQIYVNDKMIDQVDLFKRGKQSPCTCLVTVLPEANFKVVLQQQFNGNYINVSQYFVRGVAKDSNGCVQKVKVRVRQDQNSNVVVTQAQMFELVEDEVDINAQPTQSTETNDNEENTKKQMHKTINLVIEQVNEGIFDQKNIINYKNIENDILNQIASEVARSDSKNAYEEYIYLFRDKLNGIWSDYVDENCLSNLKSKLTQEEDWLYDDGEYQKADVYIKRLEDLKLDSKPIEDRCINFKQAQQLFDEFNNEILHYQKILNIYADQNDERYKHIPSDKMEIVKNEYQNAFGILINAQDKFTKWVKTTAFPFKNQDLYNSMRNLKLKCDPIVNLPVPKAEPPPVPTSTENNESGQADEKENANVEASTDIDENCEKTVPS